MAGAVDTVGVLLALQATLPLSTAPLPKIGLAMDVPWLYLSGNGGDAGHGGGLYGEGILSLVGTTVSGNSTGNGGHGGAGQSGGCQSGATAGKLGGEGGDGAGIYGVHTLVLTNTTISGNMTGGGGDGGHGGNDYCGNYAASGGIGGSGGQGGGILVADGTLVLNNDTVSRNRTGSAGVGGPGGSNANGTSAPPGNYGVPGMGGGIANPSAGTVETQDAIISDNRTSGAGPDCLGGGPFEWSQPIPNQQWMHDYRRNGH